jgi:RNA polymerase sigma factor (sigma-70 family)
LKYRQDKVLKLLEQHGEQLHHLLARLTRCEHTTRDLMQELFINLSGSRGFDKALNPYAYAWKAATNLAFSWHSQKKVNTEPLESIRLPDESSPAALEQMIQDEQLRKVLQITATFKELARNVIVMRFIEQQSYEEIAVRLGKNPDYLRALCSKTLERLRNSLDHQLSDHTDKEVCCD